MAATWRGTRGWHAATRGGGEGWRWRVCLEESLLLWLIDCCGNKERADGGIGGHGGRVLTAHVAKLDKLPAIGPNEERDLVPLTAGDECQDADDEDNESEEEGGDLVRS